MSNRSVEPFDVRKLQLVELELLNEFKRVCEKNSIPFFLAYGTCLGAVRHKGFIPWDDDVDVFVFARDLIRLREAMGSDLASGYFYQCKETDPALNMTITRLRKDGTTMLNYENVDREIHQGVCIDIYPLYEMSSNPIGKLRQKCWSMVDCLLTVHRMPLNHGMLGRLAATVGLALLDHKWVARHARRVMSAYTGAVCDTLCCLSCGWSTINVDYPAEDFRISYMEFEGSAMPVPQGYDRYLTITFGNYMKLPPIDQRKGDHTVYFVDLETDYKAYRGKKYLN